jgi:hypothetical protein
MDYSTPILRGTNAPRALRAQAFWDPKKCPIFLPTERASAPQQERADAQSPQARRPMRECEVPPRRSDDAASPRHHRQLQALRRSDGGVSPRQLEASLFIRGGSTLRQSDLFSKEHSIAHSHDRRRRHTTSSLPSPTQFRVSHHATFTTMLPPATTQRTSSTSLHQSPHSGGGAGGGADEARAALSAAFTSAMSALDLAAVAHVAARHGVRPESALNPLSGVLWRQSELLFFAFCAFAHPPPPPPQPPPDARAAPAAAASLTPPVPPATASDTAPWWRMDAPRFGALCALCELGGAVVAEDAPAAIFARAQAHYSTVRFGELYHGEGGKGAAAARASGAEGASGAAGSCGACGAAEGGGNLHVFLHALLDLAAASAQQARPARSPSKHGAAAVGSAVEGAADFASVGASADLPELFERVAARVAHQLSASPQQPGGKGGKPRQAL